MKSLVHPIPIGDMKKCNKCLKELSLDSFWKNKASKDGHAWTCKECAKARHKEWRHTDVGREKSKKYQKNWEAANPEKAAEYNRRAKLKKKYGISLEEYDILEEKQQGRCAICREAPSDPRGYRLHVDHCHNTGEIRGLLCSNCNAGIGRFQDSIERLENAIKYLT